MAINASATGPQKQRHRSGKLISEINTTIFAGVLLVLLIIFMTMGPHSRPQLPSVDLAKTDHPVRIPGARREDVLMITVKRDGIIYVNYDRIPTADLAPAILKGLNASGEKKVYVQADGRVRYKSVEEVIDALHTLGIDKVSFVVEEKKRPFSL